VGGEDETRANVEQVMKLSRINRVDCPGASIAHVSRTAAMVVIMLLLVLAGVGSPDRAGAHPELRSANPSPDAILAAPVSTIELQFSERVAGAPNPPTVQVLDQRGQELEVSDVEIDPSDPQRVTASVTGMSTGAYTVNWQATSDVDGHTLSGSFGFRVATGNAPGAATVEGERPQGWAVVTRWITFLGASLAAAAFLFVALAIRDHTPRLQQRLLYASLGASLVALLATLLEPWLQTVDPPAGAEAPTLSNAIAGLPDAWWIRPAALAIAIGIVIIALGPSRRQTTPVAVPMLGAGAALITLLGLSLTSHAAARETWSALATLSIVLHQWSVGLWIGGLGALAISWPSRATAEPAESVGASAHPIRRFSMAALILAIIGIGTGLINSGLALPSLDALWGSDYGRVLIAKLVLLVPVLGLATYHRLWLRRHLAPVGTALRATVRVETVFAVLVAGLGVVLALSALPSQSKSEIEQIDLAAPLFFNDAESPMLHLEFSPGRAGENELRVWLSDANGNLVPSSEIELIRLDIQSLNSNARQAGIVATPTDEGDFSVAGIQLSHDGWWEVNVLLRQPGQPDVTIPYFQMVPDPNINGFDAPTIPESSPEAEALFYRALETLGNLNSIKYADQLSSGQGTAVTLERQLSKGSDDTPPASLMKTAQVEILIIGDQTWQRAVGGAWIEREPVELFPPSEWVSAYDGATGFQLGSREVINGVDTQIVTLYVPETERQVAAWYAWWIDESTGHLLQEAMVSRLHYMIYEYSELNEPFEPSPPETGAGPATATLVAVSTP
jgi:copper transport protein